MQENEELGMEKVGTYPEKCERAAQEEGEKGNAEIVAEEGIEKAKEGALSEEDGQGETKESEETGNPAAHSDAWYKRDSEAFDKAYPTLDKDALFADEGFLSYAEGKVGEVPLVEIYEGYVKLKKTLTEKARTQAARANAAGSLRQTASDGEREYYTLSEMQAMSAKYIEEHWDKVQKSLKRLK